MVTYRLLKNEVAVIRLVQPTLSAAVRQGLMRLLNAAKSDKAKVICILGGSDVPITQHKIKCFSTGADILEFARGKHLVRPSLGEVIAAMDASPIPIVCGIHGYALGGGLELALACHWRLALQHPSTKLGLPEVSLGLLPGAGGTQRLPRLVGYRAALDLMTSGRHIGASEALSLGLVDKLVPSATDSNNCGSSTGAVPDFPEDAIISFSAVLHDQASKKPPVSSLSAPPAPSPEEWQGMLAAVKAGPACRGAEAPLAVLGALQASCYSVSFAQGLSAEQRLFSALLGGAQSKALQYQFMCRTKTRNKDKTQALSGPSSVAGARIQGLWEVLWSEAESVARSPGCSVRLVHTVLERELGLALDDIPEGWRQEADLLNSEISPSSSSRSSISSQGEPGSTSKAPNDAEIFARVVFPVVNSAFRLLEAGHCSVEELDLSACTPRAGRGLGLAPHKGGLIYMVERGTFPCPSLPPQPQASDAASSSSSSSSSSLTAAAAAAAAAAVGTVDTSSPKGLAAVAALLGEWAKHHPTYDRYQASQLLLDCVAAGSPVREELFFRGSGVVGASGQVVKAS